MRQIIFITALQAEARPLIEFYQLEKKQLNEKLFYFQKDEILCFTTGVGAKNVRLRLPQFLETTIHKNTVLINVGIAGGDSVNTKIGEMVTVNQIIDEKSSKSYRLKKPFNTGLKELPLTTVNAGVTDGCNNYNGLVDMEASVIYETTVRYLPVLRIIFLKIVSDHMDIKVNRPEQVIHLINNQLPEINRILHQFQNGRFGRHFK